MQQTGGSQSDTCTTSQVLEWIMKTFKKDSTLEEPLEPSSSSEPFETKISNTLRAKYQSSLISERLAALEKLKQNLNTDLIKDIAISFEEQRADTFIKRSELDARQRDAEKTLCAIEVLALEKESQIKSSRDALVEERRQLEIRMQEISAKINKLDVQLEEHRTQTIQNTQEIQSEIAYITTGTYLCSLTYFTIEMEHLDIGLNERNTLQDLSELVDISTSFLESQRDAHATAEQRSHEEICNDIIQRANLHIQGLSLLEQQLKLYNGSQLMDTIIPQMDMIERECVQLCDVCARINAKQAAIEAVEAVEKKLLNIKQRML
jgi:hypothetical protein